MDDFFQSNPGFKLLGCFQMVLTAKMSKVGNICLSRSVGCLLCRNTRHVSICMIYVDLRYTSVYSIQKPTNSAASQTAFSNRFPNPNRFPKVACSFHFSLWGPDVAGVVWIVAGSQSDSCGARILLEDYTCPELYDIGKLGLNKKDAATLWPSDLLKKTENKTVETVEEVGSVVEVDICSFRKQTLDSALTYCLSTNPSLLWLCRSWRYPVICPHIKMHWASQPAAACFELFIILRPPTPFLFF